MQYYLTFSFMFVVAKSKMSEPMDSSDSSEKPNISSNNCTTDATTKQKPSCIIVLGMAGSGKTTFVQRLVSVLYNTGKPYVINLDPACKEVPYPANIGIYNVIRLNCNVYFISYTVLQILGTLSIIKK